MLKVILVEDEVVTRESIRKNIDWEEHGYTFIGEASDGELAYALIQEKRPDVIITDIKMPFMDGLELIRLVRDELPGAKIIILSGYSDFSYAQKAIRLGASEYLLKPVTGTLLTGALDRMRKVVEDDQRQQAFLRRYEQEMEEMEKLRRQRFFEDWMTGKKQTSELYAAAARLGLSLGAQSYNVILYQFQDEDAREPLYSERLTSIQEKIQSDLQTNRRVVLFSRDMDGFALLVKGDEEESASTLSAQFSEALTSALAREPSVRYYVAVGRSVHRLSDVPKSFVAANQAFAYRFFVERSAVFFADREGRFSVPALDGVDLGAFDTSQLDKTIIERFLRSGTRSEVEAVIEELFRQVGYAHIDSLLLRQYMAMDIYFAANQYIRTLDVSKERWRQDCGPLDNMAFVTSTVKGTKSYLMSLLRKSVDLRDEVSKKQHNELVRKAREYIEKNFASDISLQKMSTVVNVSPSHFCALFSRDTGTTFIEYLTNVRMEKAKELLRCTDLKASEVAFQVGYHDSHYFSYLFKKMHGCSPRDFRARGTSHV